MAGITRVGDGVFRVDVDGRSEIVYVAGTPDDRWASWNGRVFRFGGDRPAAARRGRRVTAHLAVTAPMPARIIAVKVREGDSVKTGDTLVVLEAMKMELPILSPGDGRVRAIGCREGDLVQGDAVLVELE
jgi:biotin carboxyl carrier protein